MYFYLFINFFHCLLLSRFKKGKRYSHSFAFFFRARRFRVREDRQLERDREREKIKRDEVRDGRGRADEVPYDDEMYERGLRKSGDETRADENPPLHAPALLRLYREAKSRHGCHLLPPLASLEYENICCNPPLPLNFPWICDSLRLRSFRGQLHLRLSCNGTGRRCTARG